MKKEKKEKLLRTHSNAGYGAVIHIKRNKNAPTFPYLLHRVQIY